MGRPGRNVFKLARRRRLRWLRVNVRIVALMALLGVAYTAFVMVWEMSDLLRGLLLGSVWTAFVGMIFYFMALTKDAQPRMGGHAEQWTAKALRRLDDRWVVLHDIEFAKVNVDHVAIGPDFVVAVESKWTSGDIDLDSSVDDWSRRHIEQCQQRARRVELLLRSEGVERTVVPLLVYWGPAARELDEEPRQIGNVRVVAGEHARAWARRLCEAATGLGPDVEAAEALARYVSRREEYTRRHGSPLRGSARGVGA